MHRLMMALVVVISVASSAFAWHDEGHVYAARAAVENLPQDVPAFFREGAGAAGHLALDPDVIKDRQLPQLRDAEGAEHFLDVEMLRGREWPATRYAYYELVNELGIDPERAGTLPYAIAEYAQWLTMAFAEHRQHPDNPHIRQKALMIAGLLSHYAADLHMPLHTTVHYNGRVPRGQDGRWDFAAEKQHEGIHPRVDGLPTKLPYNVLFAEPLPEAQAHGDLMPFIRQEFDKSHALVDKVYVLAPGIPAEGDAPIENAAVRQFTIDRMRASAAFTRDIFYRAWKNSAKVDPPGWLDRAQFDERFDPAMTP